MNHSALKNEINKNTATTRNQRSEATRLIIAGRKLRAEGAALGADKPESEGPALLKQGWNNHSEGMALLWDAEAGREDRRHTHLAAALLNGRTYKRCEASYNEDATGPASTGRIEDLIAPYLTHLPEGTDANDIASDWLAEGNVKLRYDKASETVSLVSATPLAIKEAA